jgi:hypothetical protein
LVGDFSAVSGEPSDGSTTSAAPPPQQPPPAGLGELPASLPLLAGCFCCAFFQAFWFPMLILCISVPLFAASD